MHAWHDAMRIYYAVPAQPDALSDLTPHAQREGLMYNYI